MISPEILAWAHRHWPTAWGLGAFLIMAGTAAVVLIGALSLTTFPASALLVAALSATAGLWAYLRRMPKPKAGKVGFAIAVDCEEAVGATVRIDFVNALRTLIRSGTSGQSFDVFEIPNHIALRIVDVADAKELQRQCAAHFLIAGRVRRREIKKTTHDVLNIIAVVAHSALEPAQRQLFAKEFAELLPNRIFIKQEDEFPALEFTAEWAGLVAKYIIGIAAAVSNDLDYAEQLFLEVRAGLSARDTGFLIFQKLAQRIPLQIGAIAVLRGRAAIRSWYANKQPDAIDAVPRYLEAATREGVSPPERFIQEAIYWFVKERNAVRSRQALARVPKPNREAVWYLNVAFLAGYSGDLKRAGQAYRKAAALGTPPSYPDVTVGQVEDFLCWVLEVEPDKVQIKYCLGLVNWLLKGDLEQAEADLTAFANECPPVLLDHRARALEYVAEIRREAAIPTVRVS